MAELPTHAELGWRLYRAYQECPSSDVVMDLADVAVAHGARVSNAGLVSIVLSKEQIADLAGAAPDDTEWVGHEHALVAILKLIEKCQVIAEREGWDE